MKLRLPTHLESLAFISGFVLLTFELAAARVLAPTVGSSTYVWTSVIGVIIAALSLGFYMGGKIADARKNKNDVVWLLLIAAGLVALTTVLYPLVLPWLAGSRMDVRLQAVGAATILFAPTSLVLGMISPYLAKLNITSLKTSGSAIANLSAWDSIGGITGTFLTGFVLFGYMGSRSIFIVLVVVLLLATLLLKPRLTRKHLGLAGVAFLVVMLAPTTSQAINIDTPSSHYTVFEWNNDDIQYRGLAMGPGGIQSGIRLDQPNTPVFWYTNELASLIEQTPARQDILMLGGGTFTLPQQVALRHPGSKIDVVEIDPGLADIAREHFAYKDPANVNIIFEDARTYSNRATKRYDIVVVDVYGNTDIPFTFMTREYGEAVKRITKPGGVVMVNMIAGEQGDCASLLGALEAPYRRNFTQHLMKPNSTAQTAHLPHNIIGVYSDRTIAYPDYKSMPVGSTEVLTDDYAPAERIRQNCAA